MLPPARWAPMGVAAALLAWLLVAPAWWRPIQDPDVWWLLDAGAAILAGRFPTTNASSFTAPDTPWVLHEPLVAAAYAAVGLGGVAWLRGLVATATGLLLLHLAHRPGRGWATVLALLWCLPLLSGAISERALAWGTLALAGTVAALRAGRPGLAAGLVGLWAQVHGSFVVGVGLVALVAPGWAALAAGLSLLQPNGLDLWRLVAGYALGTGPQGVAAGFLVEWRPLTPDTPQAALQLGALVAGAALVLPGAARRRDKVLYVVLAVMTLRHARDAALLGVALLPVVADRLAALTPADRPLGRPLPLLAAALALTAALAPAPVVDAARYPAALLAAVPRGARTWSDHALGAWLAHGGVPVFWDARNDCYPADVLAEGAVVQWWLPGASEVLRRWGVQAVVTERPAVTAALTADGWRRAMSAGEVHLLLAP